MQIFFNNQPNLAEFCQKLVYVRVQFKQHVRKHWRKNVFAKEHLDWSGEKARNLVDLTNCYKRSTIMYYLKYSVPTTIH